MVTIGVIGGTGADLSLDRVEDVSFDTPWGRFEGLRGALTGAAAREVVFVRRHGAMHERLSSAVDHRTNIWGLRECGADAIIGTTVCGVIDPELELARPILFDDLLFPDNRLPDGSPCTFYTEPGQADRGHYIFGSPFSPSVRGALADACVRAGVVPHSTGAYAYCLGPRFNSRAEIAFLAAAGATAVSQTAGPEAVLAGELEIPYALLGFGVDYANGVTAEPTPVEVLDANIALGRTVLGGVVTAAAAVFEPVGFDTGFVYRFE